jgi:hypothetical protein
MKEANRMDEVLHEAMFAIEARKISSRLYEEETHVTLRFEIALAMNVAVFTGDWRCGAERDDGRCGDRHSGWDGVDVERAVSFAAGS